MTFVSEHVYEYYTMCKSQTGLNLRGSKERDNEEKGAWKKLCVKNK